MAYATTQDIAVRLGVAVGDLNAAQVQAFLDDSTALVNGYTGLDWTTQPEVPVAIKWVVISRTLRALQNPDGLRSEQIGSYSYTMATADAGGIGWTVEERRILDAYGNTSTSRLAGSFAIGYG